MADEDVNLYVLIERAQGGCIHSRQIIILRMHRLIKSILYKFSGSGLLTKEDLYQEAVICVDSCIDNYNLSSDKSGSFGSLAWKYINGGMKTALNKYERIIKIPSYYVNGVHRVKKEFYIRHGRIGNIGELSDFVDDIKDILDKYTIKLDSTIIKDIINNYEHISTIGDDIGCSGVYEYAESSLNKQRIYDMVSKHFGERNRDILFHYYEEDNTLKQISEKFNVSTQRVSALNINSIKFIKKNIHRI